VIQYLLFTSEVANYVEVDVPLAAVPGSEGVRQDNMTEAVRQDNMTD